MSLEDPFVIVQNEVFDALIKLRNSFTRWTELQSSNSNELSGEDYNAFVTELKNGIKSIIWDLDELEESLVNSERSATLDSVDLQKRKSFVSQTREEVKSMNERVLKGNNKLLMKVDLSIPSFGSQQLQNGTKYHRLINEPDSSHMKNFDNGEQKSPYVPNHSITIDEADHESVNVITTSSRHKNLDRVKELWTLASEKQKVAFGFITTAIVILLVVFMV